MSREPTSIAFWCDVVGRSPLCGVDLNKNHLAKTAEL